MTPAQLDSQEDVALERRFRALEAQWQDDVGMLSSSTEIINHRAFQAIIALGPAVVPFMLRDLAQRPRLWVWALPRITGENPIPDDVGGDVGRMSELWLRWGRARGWPTQGGPPWAWWG